ncbi:MAG: class E sortase [Actinobacteria bacterium]|nr:class E sortase [Actinomycetota bacterium]
MRRLARTLGTLLIVAGLLMLGWVVTVWQWQDPFTAVIHEFDQRELSKSFERRVDLVVRPTRRPAATAAEVRRGVGREARAWSRDSGRGAAIARLRIPRLGLNEIVVNGTDSETLKRGPGRYLGSGMPGEGELVYIAGHRTTYGAPFSHIDRLAKGDPVFLELPYGTLEYVVTGHRIVASNDLSVLRSRGYEQLALQACHPRFFATQRYIAYAKPVSVTPPGATEASPLAAG